MSEIKVKGTGLISTRNYIQNKYPNDAQQWLESLPQESRALYLNDIKTTQWYPIKEAYYYALFNTANMFFDGDMKKAGIDIGKYSAEFGMNGVFNVIKGISSPHALIKSARKLFALHYKGLEIEIKNIEDDSIELLSTQVSPGNDNMDYRTIGWCLRTFELAGCNNVQYERLKQSDPSKFAVKFNWDN